MPAHWYTGKRGRNFGDALTAVLFDQLAHHVRLQWVPAEQAELFGAGSIAHRIPPGFTGYVWGTGYMWEHQGADLATAKVLAVRGALTEVQGHLGRLWGTGQVLLADPGLLAPQLLRKRGPRPRRRTAVVPHYIDTDLARRWRGHVVNVLAPPARVVAEVASCDRVVTSSLHALILADALGIPSRWEPCAAVIGHGHKFRDYATAYGEQLRPGEWRMADQAQVAEKADQLLAAMHLVR